MLRAITLTLLWSTGCFVAPYETVLGNHTGGGSSAAGGGSSGGGTAGGAGTGGGQGNGPQTPEGDAACDQSTCLPATGNFGSIAVPQLAQDAQYLYAITDRPEEYTGSLVRIEKSTGARRVFYRDESNPIDSGIRVLLRGGYLYFGKTYAGEIWGIIARIPVGGGAHEEVFDSFGGSGNPRTLPYDVTGTQIVWGAGTNLYASPIPVTPTSRVTLHTSASTLRDLVIAGATIWFIDDGGIRQLDLTGGALLGTISGNYRQLVADGTDVYALRADGAIVHANGANPNAALATFAGATSFQRANGAFYAVKADATATTSALVDATGTLLEVQRTAQTGFPVFATFAVDAQRLYLGTNETLGWKSAAAATATCGCAPTAPVIPAAAQACLRNLCPTRVMYSAGMVSGAIDGVHLWGVFYDSNASATDLTRYNLNGGNGVTFEQNAQLIGAIGTDTDNVYYATSYGDLKATDKQATAVRTLTSDLRTYPYEPALLVFDATHVYYLAADGIRRVAKAGGATALVTSDLGSTQLQLDETHVYFVSKGQLKRAPKVGGTVELLTTDFVFEPGYGLSGPHAYFLTARGIERVKKDGTGFKTLVLAAEKLAGLPVLGLTVQTGDLLVTTSETTAAGAGALWRVALEGGAREKVLQLGAGHHPLGHLVDAKGFALSSWQDTTWREKGCSCPAP